MHDPQEQAPGSIAGWFAGRLPDDWFEQPPMVSVDRDEILVVGRVAAPAEPADEGGGSDAAGAAAAQAESGRITRFREQTREARMAIAREAQHRFGRKVAWGVKLVGSNADRWLADLRDALESVHRVREQGPGAA